MRFVDRLRIRQVIALIALLPMLVGSVAVGLLARSENRTRSLAVQELEDLEVLMTIRSIESSVAAERAFYEGWFSVMAAAEAGQQSTLLLPALRTSVESAVTELGDASIAAIETAPLSELQQQKADIVVKHWLTLRTAFARNDRAQLNSEAVRLGDAVASLGQVADDIVARQGARWLPIDRQSRFGVSIAEEMSFVGVILATGMSSEVDRHRAAVLTDRATAAFESMMKASNPEQRERLRSIEESSNLAELRSQAQLPTITMSLPDVAASLVKLTDVTAVVETVRQESAESIRRDAASKAAAATTKRNIGLGSAAVVMLGPLLLVVSVGGRISGRLEALAKAARRVSNGEMDVRIDEVSGRDEIAEVSAAFNQVAETVARSHDQISALAEGRIDDPILDDELPGVIGQTLRLALRRLGNATAELAHQANHDKLTGLLDRRGLQAGVDSFDRRAEDASTERGMILVDLDDFKSINDGHGHAAGDAVLRAVANRLVSGTRRGDLVARLGGDEFLILTADYATCEATAERLAEQIAEPLEWNGLMVPVTASLGFTAVGFGEQFEDVLHRADKAMYAAKRSGKNRSFSG